MFLKLVVNGMNDGTFPLVTLGVEAVVFDLKRNLKKICVAPTQDLMVVKLMDRDLKDYDLMIRIMAKCRSIGMPDLTVFYKEKLVCKMSFVNMSLSQSPRGVPEILCLVIPLPIPLSYYRIFKILEKQNHPLDTSLWCVISHTLLQPCSDNVRPMGLDENLANMELIVYIDKASAEYIASHCFELRYLVWRIPCERIWY